MKQSAKNSDRGYTITVRVIPVSFPFQFCEWISTPVISKWAGPIIDLLLEHVGHAQLCSRLTELLDSREEWLAVKRKSCKRLPKSLDA